MAGAEPRDFYLFMWMVCIRFRAEIVECSKKGAALSVVMEMIFVSHCMINAFE